MTKFPSHFHDADENLVPHDGSPVTWRISAYGLIIKDQSLLIIKNKDEKFHDIPGGGVELGESIELALQRESMEEAGAKIEIGKLIYTYEDFFFHREQNAFYQTLQLFYQADLTAELTTPTDPRTTFAGLMPLSEIEKYPLPKAVKVALQTLLDEDKAVIKKES